jgi:hypothetical protein
LIPEPSFSHLRRLTDQIGLYEHADGAVPQPIHGYCTDDVARALIVVVREQGTNHDLYELGSIYLDFVASAIRPDGRFHNRRGPGPHGKWLDEVGSDDTTGRALWALGAAAASCAPGVRMRALSLFEQGTNFESCWPRANAAAVLGSAEVVRAQPANTKARRLLECAATRLGTLARTEDWPWPEPRLAYENARLPQARIAAGVTLGDERLIVEGLALLDWLVQVETTPGRFSFAPVRGWARGEPRPAFDQQPIEAGAMADACAQAFAATGDSRWADACLRAAAWFLGENDVGVPLLDPLTRGCHDGLEAAGVNLNEGAESALALISALQQARAVQATCRKAARSASASTTAAPT